MHRPAFCTLTALAVLMLPAATPTARADSGPPHWSYSGEDGPEHWASLDPTFATCGLGKHQSPIDIRSAVARALPPIEFGYQPIALTVTDTGRTLQVNVAAGSGGITVGGEHYELVQFHFHRPSEERIQGRRYAMVAHLVHRNAKGELAVVAVLLREGRTNEFLKPLFDNFPSGKPEATVGGATLQLGELLPRQRGYYSFEGSLTIPPCSENVRWLVLKSPVELSAAQVKQFAAHYSDNARPLQPLNGRRIEETRD